MSPFVSVVIPTFNRASLIERAVTSCLTQSLSDIEIIVVDDGSTDNTESVVNSIADPRIRYLRHSINRGGSVARNTGIDEARAPWIAFLDSDDQWTSQKLTRQIAAVEQARVGGASHCAAYSQLVATYPNGHVDVWPKQGIPDGMSVGDYLFLARGIMQTSTLLVSTESARACRFDEELPKHQDFDFCVRLQAHIDRFVFVKEPLVIFHLHDAPDRVSQKGNRRSLIWAEKARTLLSRRAYSAFMAKYAAPSVFATDPIGAMRILWAAALSGAVPPTELPVAFLRTIMPSDRYRHVSNAVKRWIRHSVA